MRNRHVSDLEWRAQVKCCAFALVRNTHIIHFSMTDQYDARSPRMSAATVEPAPQSRSDGLAGKLFLASFVALYFELVVIRYLSTEIRVFAYLKNLPLIASFFGIGLGMILGAPGKRPKVAFPVVALVLFLLTAFAPTFHLTHIVPPPSDYYIWGSSSKLPGVLVLLRFLGVVLSILALVVAFFVFLGGIVGECLTRFAPLPGYGINLAGSLAGVAVFTLLAFLRLPPVAWIFIGLLCLAPFFRKNRWALVLFLLTVVATLPFKRNVYWSPYYRIDVRAYPAPSGWPRPAGYELRVNHDYHQHLLDLSNDFVSRYPELEPNKTALVSYLLPYRVAPHPAQVLVVGAGTGNDVAAALRQGAEHVDAVEIDPSILDLGRRYHPEHPYDSPRVTVYNDDARAFFKKNDKTYDLIVFGFLDSHTLLSSFSSLRLDNFVYTRESFQEAGRMLRPGGTMVLTFGTGRSFVNQRIYATLADAFGSPPQVYPVGYMGGLSFVIRKAQAAPPPEGLPDIGGQLAQRGASTLVATDQWPFLYLASRSIPQSIVWVLVPFLIGAFYLVQRTVSLPRLASRQSLHLFLLGAGFLLLETKGVTELSLLFGSTWTVNAVVIAAFLCMALLANALAMHRPLSRPLAYAALLLLLGLGLWLPYSLFGGLSPPLKVLLAALVVGLPVFFSGMIFSQSFRDVAAPAQGLGVNLLGAVVGGTLENAVMIGGTLWLGVLAIALYALSAMCMSRSKAASDFARPLDQA